MSLNTVSRRQAVTVNVMKTSSQARTITAVRACRTPPLSHSSSLIDSSTLLEALLTHTEHLKSAQSFSIQYSVFLNQAQRSGGRATKHVRSSHRHRQKQMISVQGAVGEWPGPTGGIRLHWTSISLPTFTMRVSRHNKYMPSVLCLEWLSYSAEQSLCMVCMDSGAQKQRYQKGTYKELERKLKGTENKGAGAHMSQPVHIVPCTATSSAHPIPQRLQLTVCTP